MLNETFKKIGFTNGKISILYKESYIIFKPAVVELLEQFINVTA